MQRVGRAWLPVAGLMTLWVGQACAQTQPGQTDPFKQTPEGRAAGTPTQPMNCSATVSRGDDGKTTTTSNCPAAQDKPVPSNAAQQFPYPGEPAATPEPQKQQQSSGAPDAPASKRFPYPGEQDAQPSAPQPSSSSSSSSPSEAKPADSGGLQDAGSSGSSSSSSPEDSSSSSSSSSAQGAGAPDEGSPKDDSAERPAAKSSRKKLPPVPRQTPTQRELEDLQVAGFYQNDGNFTGAYARAKDAVSIAGDDPEAHLALAEAARRLGKLDEAMQNYKRCLELDPVPKTRKIAEKSLKEMTGGA